MARSPLTGSRSTDEAQGRAKHRERVTVQPGVSHGAGSGRGSEGRTAGDTDRHTDSRTHGRTDGRTDRTRRRHRALTPSRISRRPRSQSASSLPAAGQSKLPSVTAPERQPMAGSRSFPSRWAGRERRGRAGSEARAGPAAGPAGSLRSRPLRSRPSRPGLAAPLPGTPRRGRGVRALRFRVAGHEGGGTNTPRDTGLAETP